jgi:translation initiation factor 1
MAKKNLKNVVYSTNPNYSFEYDQEEEVETLSKNEQKLYVSLDRKQRAGKEATLIEGFVGSPTDLTDLGKLLKQKCGVGGTAKEGIILIQGNFKDKIFEILVKDGYNVKKKGG